MAANMVCYKTPHKNYVVYVSLKVEHKSCYGGDTAVYVQLIERYVGMCSSTESSDARGFVALPTNEPLNLSPTI